MIWRGNSSPAGWFNGNGWFHGGVRLGDGPDNYICEGDACYPVAARLNPEATSSIYENLKKAQSINSQCFPSGIEKVIARIEKAMASAQPAELSIGLTKAESEAVTTFEACWRESIKTYASESPSDSAPFSIPSYPIPAADKSNIPWVPIGIGAGALVLIGVLAS